MSKLVIILITIFSSSLFANNNLLDKNHFIAFCYHDVSYKVTGKLDFDTTSINTGFLINHFTWLKDNGYTVVSAQQVREAKKGHLSLPEKSVLLTFDDGYKSFYRTVYPLLKQFNYPATFAIMTDWIGNPEEEIMYGKEVKKKADFMTWEQIKELSNSPLIEIASHTNNLHKGIIANPQGNTQPAATSREYSDGKYETDEHYRQRIYADLKKSYDLIKQNTGVAPKSLVWPYGSYSIEAWEIAKKIGFETSMNLVDKINDVKKSEHINRMLISDNPSLTEFKDFFRPSKFIMPQRVVHVDLDYIYDKSPVQQNKNLGLMLERIKKYEISTIYLQAFSDSDGDGNADAVYFPNSILPMKADLFNRVAWQLRTRTGVKVYAWMPVSAIKIEPNLQQKLAVKKWHNGQAVIADNDYQRLSIFKPETLKIMTKLYADLAKHAKFTGILFHDDGILTDDEDVSPEALAYYKEHGLAFDSAGDLLNNLLWSRLKTKALIEFTNELRQQVYYYLPTIKTARNIYAQVIVNPESEQWFAQNLKEFVKNYDTTAIMAMPYMEQAKNPKKWLTQLADIINQSNLPKAKIIFELQAKNWHNKSKIVTKELIQQFQLLQQKGIMNYGYYPDDFLMNHPNFTEIFPEMSLTDFPYYKR